MTVNWWLKGLEGLGTGSLQQYPSQPGGPWQAGVGGYVFVCVLYIHVYTYIHFWYDLYMITSDVYTCWLVVIHCVCVISLFEIYMHVCPRNMPQVCLDLAKHVFLRYISMQRARNMYQGPEVLGTRYLVPVTWCLVAGTRYLVPGLVPGTWCQVPGARYLVPGGTGYLVPGTWYHAWYLVPGTWYLIWR